MAGGGGEGGAERGLGVEAVGAGGEVGGDEDVAGAGDARGRHGRRREGDRLVGAGGGGWACAVGDDGVRRACGAEGFGGGAAVREGAGAERLGFEAVEVERRRAEGEEGGEAGGFLGAGGDEGERGGGEGGVAERGLEDGRRQVAVEDGGAAPAAVVQGGEEGEAGALEAGAVGDAGVERAARALDGEVAVGGAVVAEEAGAVDAGGGEAGGELVAGASRPMAERRATGRPRAASARATFCATPPGWRETRPGTSAPGGSGAAVRAMMSQCAAPTQRNGGPAGLNSGRTGA